MDFSYSSYEKLISLLKQYNYSITDYNNYKKYEKSVILRHDIDSSKRENL